MLVCSFLTILINYINDNIQYILLEFFIRFKKSLSNGCFRNYSFSCSIHTVDYTRQKYRDIPPMPFEESWIVYLTNKKRLSSSISILGMTYISELLGGIFTSDTPKNIFPSWVLIKITCQVIYKALYDNNVVILWGQLLHLFSGVLSHFFRWNLKIINEISSWRETEKA